MVNKLDFSNKCILYMQHKPDRSSSFTLLCPSHMEIYKDTANSNMTLQMLVPLGEVCSQIEAG